MSLFANVGFRDYEIQNRKFLSGALEAANVEKNPMQLLFSEHELSVKASDSKSEIVRQERDGELVFLGSGKELLKLSGPIIKVSDNYKKQFVRFFRHIYGGHPSLIEQLSTSAGIYPNITIWQRNVGQKKIHIEIASLDEKQLGDYSLKDLKLNMATSGRLVGIVERISDDPETSRKKAEQEILRNARNLIDTNDLVGAMLAYLEYTLVSGSKQIPWTEKDRELLLNSGDVREMLSVTGGSTNQEEAVSKIASMEEMREKKKAGNHILKIFESNTRASIGDTKIAHELMMDALEMNPYIAGAWKDLGGFFFKNYEPYEAWVCWDLGRKINPEHPLLKDINNFEDHLQVKHAGLF